MKMERGHFKPNREKLIIPLRNWQFTTELSRTVGRQETDAAGRKLRAQVLRFVPTTGDEKRPRQSRSTVEFELYPAFDFIKLHFGTRKVSSSSFPQGNLVREARSELKDELASWRLLSFGFASSSDDSFDHLCRCTVRGSNVKQQTSFDSTLGPFMPPAASSRVSILECPYHPVSICRDVGCAP